MEELSLKSEGVIKTVERLQLRIADRFPESGLSKVCERLCEIAQKTHQTVEWISRPNYALRALSFISIAGLVASVVLFVYAIGIGDAKIKNFMDLVTTADSTMSLLILLCVAIVFIWTAELRIKRNRVVGAVNRLRDVAHVIDMHQLTKDPDGVARIACNTEHSPDRNLSPYELRRYLNYCTEMLSLISKLGSLYITKLDDSVATDAANDLESLTTGLSRKIWQKIIILNSMAASSKKVVTS